MKKYIVKIYNSKGNYITSWSDVSFNGFKKTINGGLGECRIKLARRFDDFGEYEDVKLNNKVEIYCSDGDTSSEGDRIYSGFISNYSPSIRENREGVDVVLLGYVSKLATSILKNSTQVELKTDTSSGLTTGDVASSCEVRDVVKAIIDRYQAEAVNPIINYSSTSTEDSGNTFTYTFNSKYYNEALEVCREYAPSNWWWFVDADNVLNFKPKPSKPDHYFVFGKHFKSINVEKNMENVINRVLFSSGDSERQILKLYSDTDSSDDYDDRWDLVTDNRVSVEETADNSGEAILAEKKDADVKTTIEILDNNSEENGYDIESINPGDTCKFLNLDPNISKTFSGIMTIKSVSYTPDSATIEIETLSIDTGKEIFKNNEKIDSQEAPNRPKSYDTVDTTNSWGRRTVLLDEPVQILSFSGSNSVDWTDLDCSSYVSHNAIGTILRLTMKSSSITSNTFLSVRRNGSTNEAAICQSQVVNYENRITGICACDTNKNIEYKINCNAGSGAGSIYLLGFIE